MSRWRMVSLSAVHLLIIGHIVHWLVAGRTLAPVEPSEAMYTLNDGYVNAGFIFFALSLAATVVLGRFVCGWGCHMVAYQDLCAWLLKKLGITPKPFRSRILVFAPLALAAYMFIWPTAYRWWVGYARPPLTNHLIKARFWETFPGVAVGVLTLFVCGFLIVYFLGSKGFCTYACPYGGFFGLAGSVAPGRILVTDACARCGHCTAACSSNVRVHEEVKLHGMVVDPGCMKCMDCVSVCPSNALYFGFARPPVGVKSRSARRAIRYDFRRWEEVLMVVVGVGALLTFRGLYGEIPLLLAMALAAITAYLSVKALRLIHAPNVRLQNLQLSRGGRLTRVGLGFAISIGVLSLFAGHSAAIQYNNWRGEALLRSLSLGDEVWVAGTNWWGGASAEQRARLDRAITCLQRVNRWGLLETRAAHENLVWLFLAKGLHGEAEHVVQRLIVQHPHRAELHYGLGGVLRKTGRRDEAERAYRRALSIDPLHQRAREDLAAILYLAGRGDGAVALLREAIERSPDDTHWPITLGRLLVSLGRKKEAADELDGLLRQAPNCTEARSLRGSIAVQLGDTVAGLDYLERVVALEPDSARARYDLGMALLSLRRIDPAIEHLRAALQRDPDVAVAHYNLGVAQYMAGRPGESIRHVRESIRLVPDDPISYGFLALVLRELGDFSGAREAAVRAKRLGKRP